MGITTRAERWLQKRSAVVRERAWSGTLAVVVVTMLNAAVPLHAASNVAVLGEDFFTGASNVDIFARLNASFQFDDVGMIDLGAGTPTLAQLQQYCAVFVYTGSWLDDAALGNNLADYVDSGGGVVAAMFTTAALPIPGRFATDNYWAMQPTPFSYLYGTREGLGTIFEPNHPILAGVNTFDGGLASYRPGFDNLHPQATRIANWTGPGTIPLIATRIIGGQRRVDLGFYPPANGLTGPPWDTATDGALIMANALSWVCSRCGDGVVEGREVCDDGNLIDNDGCDSNCQATGCGNGVVTAGEQCDDGNPFDGDCCSSSCTSAPDGTDCNDQRYCNGADSCSNGACATHEGDPCANGSSCNNRCSEVYHYCQRPSGTACTDDGNVCTRDECNAQGICAHPIVDYVPCNDGIQCNGQDLCQDGTCSYHYGNPCEFNTCSELCDEATVTCLPSTSGTACFDDGFECTSDECDGAGACVHLPLPNCATFTPLPTHTRTPTPTSIGTSTQTLTPINTPSPTSAPAPAALVLRRVRLKANTNSDPGNANGSATGRAVINANSPFDGLESDISAAGVSLRIAGAGGVEMTLIWPASSCVLNPSNRGARITCTAVDANGKRKLKLRPTVVPNVYTMHFAAKQISVPAPRSAAPARVVVITQSFARQDDIYACTVAGAQAQVSLCIETGVLPPVTPAPPLGDRVFSVGRPGSKVISTAIGGAEVTIDPWLPSVLRLRAGAPDVDGVASLELLDDVILGGKIVDGSTFCMKIYAAGSFGSIDCDGGSPFDVMDTYDSNGAGPSGAYVRQSGLGGDAGPGAATLFASWNGYNLPVGSTINDCLQSSYSFGPQYGFTTAMATGTFINTVQGGTVSQSAVGENFDCASWTQEDGPGKLLRPLLPTNTIIGDIANVLILADAYSIPPLPTPTTPAIPPTSATSRTPTTTATPTRTSVSNTPTPTSIFNVKSCNFGGAPSDALLMSIAGAAFPPLAVQGQIAVGCMGDGSTGTRQCDCEFHYFNPVSFVGIGFVCIENGNAAGGLGACPVGRQVCGSSPASVNVDLFADAAIGACSDNADCQTQCDAYCAALQPSRARFSSGCESHCQGSDRAEMECDCDRLGTATCAPGSTLDCPNGSCEGKDNEADIDCHCQCIDEAAPPTSSDGGFACRLSTQITIETNTPCDGTDVLVRLAPVCAPFTSDQSAGMLINANEDAVSAIVLTPLQGTHGTCSAFDTSPAGMQLVTTLAFFDSTIGDLSAQLSLTCY